MQLSEQTSNWFALGCLIGAFIAFGKALESLVGLIFASWDEFVVVERRESFIDGNLHVTTFYHFGMGDECVFNGKAIVHKRPFRWVRTKQGEIREVGQ